MPIRFSTEAANADHMGTDADTGAAPAGTPNTVGTDRHPQHEPRSGAQGDPDKTNAGKAGKDINAPGFIKEKDSDKA